jgi:hypothetical protein
MSEAPKPPPQPVSGRKTRRNPDEGLALIIAVRALQLAIIVVLWLVTSYFGHSCDDPAFIRHKTARPTFAPQIKHGEPA